MGFSILPRNRFCSIIISGFWLGFRGLSPYSFGILFHHHFLVPARVPGLVSLLLASCSIIISWLGFRGLSPYFFAILFHHHFLVPARVPGLVSLLFWHPVPSSFPGSSSGSGACLPILLALCGSGSGAGLPTLLAFCSIIISWFRLGFRGSSPYSSGILFRVPGIVPSLLAFCSIFISWFRLGFRGLSP